MQSDEKANNGNYYRLLKLEKDPMQDQIREAYRKAVQKYHPDKVASLGTKLRILAEEEMKKINEAYEVLMDPEKRARYDSTAPVTMPSLDKEECVTTGPRYELMKGMAYLVKYEDAEVPFILFKDLVTHGHQGLIITRSFPKIIRNSYALKKSSIIWLSRDTPKEMTTIQPGQLGLLHHKIHEFLKKSEKGVVLLDGVEYLITQNSFPSVLKVIQLITGKIALFNANLILPLNPYAFEKKDISLFSREFRMFTHPDFEKAKVEFTEIHWKGEKEAILKCKLIAHRSEFVITGNSERFGRMDFIDGLPGEKLIKISREHFDIDIKNNRFYITDRKSGNGTWVNGGKLKPGRKYELNDGDEIIIAGVLRLEFGVFQSLGEKGTDFGGWKEVDPTTMSL